MLSPSPAPAQALHTGACLLWATATLAVCCPPGGFCGGNDLVVNFGPAVGRTVARREPETARATARGPFRPPILLALQFGGWGGGPPDPQASEGCTSASHRAPIPASRRGIRRPTEACWAPGLTRHGGRETQPASRTRACGRAAGEGACSVSGSRLGQTLWKLERETRRQPTPLGPAGRTALGDHVGRGLAACRHRGPSPGSTPPPTCTCPRKQLTCRHLSLWRAPGVRQGATQTGWW